MPFNVIMVAFGFGGFGHSDVFRKLCMSAGAKNVLIADRNYPLPTDVPHVHLLIIPADADEANKEALQAILNPPTPRYPKLSQRGPLSAALTRQIRDVSSSGDLAEGKRIIRQLVHYLAPEVGEFRLHGLGQGFSGAMVFGVSTSSKKSRPNSPKEEHQIEWVLKLTTRRDKWKCQHELKHYEEIRKQLEIGPVQQVPLIRGMAVTPNSDVLPAECEEWFGVMYGFVGGRGVVVRDFEQVFLDPEACLAVFETGLPPNMTAESLPSIMIERLIDTLGRLYRHSDCLVNNHPWPRRLLWSMEEAPAGETPSFPPYRFSQWEKSTIARSIASLENYSVSLPGKGWKAKHELARRCVTASTIPQRLRPLAIKRKTFLSPAHGDLNANNVLMMLDIPMLFLIDFANYQANGHSVQDLARFEVATKLELMGCEKNGPKGKDLDLDEFVNWCEAETWLTGWPDDRDGSVKLPPSLASSSSVRRAYELCGELRNRGWRLHQTLSNSYSKPSYVRSYNAALLYHTLRAIRYDSLPHLKRILAIHSVHEIVNSLK